MAHEPAADVRKTIQLMKSQLKTLRTHLTQISDSEKNAFNKLTYALLGEYTGHLANLTMMVDELLESSITMKEQLDILKIIVLEIPEVKQNPALRKKINAAVKEYRSKHQE